MLSTKEPWQMTKEEYGNYLIAVGKHGQELASKHRLPAGQGGPIYTKYGERLNKDAAYMISNGLAIKLGIEHSWGNPHKIEIEVALRNGKLVPENVLAEYPELIVRAANV